ncbi:MAG: transketolase, partial [Phocaeicola sp.]
ANKIKNSPSQVYVLCGDGEFCEGTMWESCIFAGAKKLDNLCLIIDDNDSVGAMVSLGDMSEKLSAFGFDTRSVNGHDMKELEACFKELRSLKNGKPKAVIAHTVRGYGSQTMTEHDIWFHKAPNEEELKMLTEEVDEF